MRPEIGTVVKNIGSSRIGNTPQKGYSRDKPHGFRVTGHSQQPFTHAGSRPL